ncbi:MAG TPA: HisA/HisF-related TIM barrel protein [Xanthobacteraceae bacterium]|nr:HisA/HisF-related TIM barrel protein [Xanthobacteraceae bacterium]
MPANRIIPSLLLRRGRLAKGVRFADYRDAGAPATICRAHSAQGADEILLLDIEASHDGRESDFGALEKVAAEIQVPLTFGGGMTNLDRIHRAIEAGADKVCLTTAALDRPDLIEEAAQVYGAQAVMVGIDVVRRDGDYKLYDHRTGWTVSKQLDDWVGEAVSRGAGEIRLCAVDREGTRQGLDTTLHDRVRARVNVPIILEGGVGDLDHVAAAMKAGADSIGLGTLLVFSDNNLVKVRRFLANEGLKVRS